MKAVVLCSGLAIGLMTMAHGNLLTNGDFEAGVGARGDVPGWSLSKEAELQLVWVDGENARTGKGCLAVRSVRTTTAPAIVSQRVAVEPNARYVLSLWMKRDSYVYGTEIRVALLKAGQAVGSQETQFRGSEWFPVCLGFDSGDADAAEVQLVTPNTGTWRVTMGRTLWVDDVQLAKIEPQDNLMLRAATASNRRGCVESRHRGAAAGGCLAVSGGERATFGFDIPLRKGGPYYVWLRALSPGRNQFTVRSTDGREWPFRCHTPSPDWRWVRPVLPELMLSEGRQRVEFSAQGEGVLIDRIALTMDPFWQPEGAPEFQTVQDAIAAQRRAGFTAERRAAVELSILGSGDARPWTQTRWPVSQGVPFPRGQLGDAAHVRLVDGKGAPLPCQAETLTRWPDGSVKWLLVSTFAADGSGCRLEYGTEVRAGQTASRLRVTEDAGGVEIVTGKLKARIAKDGSPLLGGVWLDGNGDRQYGAEEQVVASGHLRANGGFVSNGHRPEVVVEERGPVRATVKVSGQFVSGDKKLLDYVLRIYAFEGAAFLAMEPTFLRRDGTLKIALDDVTLALDLAASRTANALTWQDGETARTAPLNGRSATLVSRVTSDPKRPNDFPYSVRVGDEEVGRGVKCAGAVRALCGETHVGMGVRHFWQNSPKSFTVGPRRLEVGLVAPGNPIEFFKGMAKTHEVLLHFGEDAAPLECFAAKPLLVASPEWYCQSRAFDAFPLPRRADRYPHYERCLDATLAVWLKSLGDTMLRPGAGGMIHVGDFGSGGGFGNLESALDEGLMVQFLRTGSRAAFDQAELSINHFSDVDIDHSADNAGLIHVHGQHGREVKNPLTEGVNGHSWFNGVTCFSLFTGSRRILEQAADVGRYYSRHQFPLQPYIHYWRQIAWKLMDLLCAYDVTGDAAFLEAARRDVVVTRHQRDHVITLWPYMCGAGLKALRHYFEAIGDLEARELYLQMMDGFLHLRARPNDTVNGEHPKLPGMLLGNFPNDRSCEFYNELAHACFLSGDRRYAEMGGADLNWQVKFNVNDPTLLMGSSDLANAMSLLGIPGPAVVQTLPAVFMTERAEPSPLLPAQQKPTVTFQVVETTDQPFTVHLFKDCYRKYTTAYRGTAILFDPDGQVVGEQRVSTEGLKDYEFAVPKDGKVGVYTLQVSLDDIWRWTIQDASFELSPGEHVLKVASRYDLLCFDQLVLTPDLTYFPWLTAAPPEAAIVLEAESAALARGYEVLENAAASGKRYVRSTVGGNTAAMDYPFKVPVAPGGDANAKRTYRFFARVWKPYADLLNVSVDELPPITVPQVHDMDGNTYPVWAVGTSLGDAAVVRYWETDSLRGMSRYSAKYLRPEGWLKKRM